MYVFVGGMFWKEYSPLQYIQDIIIKFKCLKTKKSKNKYKINTKQKQQKPEGQAPKKNIAQPLKFINVCDIVDLSMVVVET